MIIVDTNVIAYLVVPGDNTPLAEGVHDKDPVWAAPWLWRSEMRNLLTLYVRRGILELNDVLEYMTAAEDLLQGREHNVTSDVVLTLAADSGCTAYDCEFVYLAEKLSAQLVTSEKKLLEAFPQTARSMQQFVSEF